MLPLLWQECLWLELWGSKPVGWWWRCWGCAVNGNDDIQNTSIEVHKRQFGVHVFLGGMCQCTLGFNTITNPETSLLKPSIFSTLVKDQHPLFLRSFHQITKWVSTDFPHKIQVSRNEPRSWRWKMPFAWLLNGDVLLRRNAKQRWAADGDQSKTLMCSINKRSHPDSQEEIDREM